MPSPISFIIPALNEEAALTPMLDGLRAALDAAACADVESWWWTTDPGRGLLPPATPRSPGILGGTLRAGRKILWTIAKHGFTSRR